MKRRKALGLITSVSAMPMVSWALSGQSSAGFDSSKTIHTIAFGSCAFQWADQPIWDVILARNPDLFLFLGDAIYGDFDGKSTFTPTRESLTRDWNKLATKPGFRTLRRNVPVMATWDNHDYGKHDGGAEYLDKEMSKEVFLDFFSVPEDAPERSRGGIYTSRILGPEGRRVQVIMLDNRWFRGELIPDSRTEEERKALGVTGSMGHQPNTDPTASLLGEQQWTWLETELQKPAELKIICSGTQIVNDSKGMQEWGNFPLERKRLFDLIERVDAAHVIMLSGNVHYSEVCRTDEGPYPLFDFTSSGLTHNSEAYASAPSPRRVAGPYSENNFGLVEVDWESTSAPVVTFSTVGIGGSVAFNQKIDTSILE